jgi:hypothetical protein
MTGSHRSASAIPGGGEMRIFVTVCAAVVALAGPAAAEGKTPPQPGPEMVRLTKALAGTWSITYSREPTVQAPMGETAKGEEVWRPGPGGFSLIEDYRSSGELGKHTGLEVTWWDEDAQAYQVLWCDNGGPPACLMISKHGMTWEGDDLVARNEWQANGKTFVSREVFSDITPKSFKQIVYEGESGREKKLFTILAFKAKSPH